MTNFEIATSLLLWTMLGAIPLVTLADEMKVNRFNILKITALAGILCGPAGVILYLFIVFVNHKQVILGGE